MAKAKEAERLKELEAQRTIAKEELKGLVQLVCDSVKTSQKSHLVPNFWQEALSGCKDVLTIPQLAVSVVMKPTEHREGTEEGYGAEVPRGAAKGGH